MKTTQALVLAKTKERDYPRPGCLNVDIPKFKFGKKYFELSNGRRVKHLKTLALIHYTTHHGKFLPLLLEGSFPDPFSTQDFDFSSHCAVKL